MTGVQKDTVCVIVRKISSKTVKQCFWRFIIILSNIFCVISEENCSVSWELTTIPIVFGDNISLKCTAQGREHCFGSRIFKWIGGPEKEVISFDGQIYDHNKYAVFYDRGYYWLVIKNSTARDIGIPYACHCGFYYSESILKNVSLIHSDDKELTVTVGDKQGQQDMTETQEDETEKGTTDNASMYIGLCAGAIIGVILVVGLVGAIYKIYKQQRGSKPRKTQMEKHKPATDSEILAG